MEALEASVKAQRAGGRRAAEPALGEGEGGEAKAKKAAKPSGGRKKAAALAPRRPAAPPAIARPLDRRGRSSADPHSEVRTERAIHGALLSHLVRRRLP